MRFNSDGEIWLFFFVVLIMVFLGMYLGNLDQIKKQGKAKRRYNRVTRLEERVKNIEKQLDLNR